LTIVSPSGIAEVYLFRDDGKEKLATRNLTPGISLLNEKLVKAGGSEYRLWSPYRSKLAAAILRGMRSFSLKRGDSVLYLGAASGTTASYVSDIVGGEGVVFCVEFAPRPMKELLRLCELRANMIPILADARRPETYAHLVCEVDFLYQDVAQPDQSDIFCSNARGYLKAGGSGLLMVKSRSVDVARKPEEIFEEEVRGLEACGITVAERVVLDPFVKDHIALVTRSDREG